MKPRYLTFAMLIALVSASAVADMVEYRMTRCVSIGEDRFSVSFEGPRKERRRIALYSNGFEFGGNVKGAVPLSGVKELRLSPVLEVVFVRPEHSSLQFGRLSSECRRLIEHAVGQRVRIRDGET